ncbi:hypothetical protein ACHAW6_014476 [Cyclotella cf. meneghiniana]
MSSGAPRRGKFLSPPPPSSPSKPADKPSSSIKPAASRGKVLGKTLMSPSSAHSTSTLGGAHASDADRDSLTNIRNAIHQAREAAAARRREVAAQRDRIFEDLDKAETIILSLLDCASEVAHALSEMTSAKMSGEKGKADAIAFEELAAKVRGNGVGYLSGVKKLHQLLAPHASFVKSYRNPDEDTSIAPAITAEKEATDATVANGENGKMADAIVKKATSNMYAARVEKRLALERSAILKEMIRLEELESAGNAQDSIDGAGAAGLKRRRESLDQVLE